MSDALEHEVKLIVDVVSNLRAAAREIDEASEAVGGLSSKGDKAIATVHRLADELDKTAKSGRDAKDALEIDRGTTKQWDALADRIEKASKAYQELSRTRAAAGKSTVDVDSFMAEQGVSTGDLDNYRQGKAAGFLKDEANARKQVEAAANDMAEAERRLLTIQTQRAQGEAAEANRQMEIRVAINQRAKAERELADAIAQQQAAAKNAERASAYATPRGNSFLGQGQESGLKASDTTWARDSNVRMAAARQALADYDKQLNNNTTSYKANTSALASMLRQEQEQEAALPRLRYALYDVATTAGITATAIAAVGASILTSFGSMESAFTNVERTLDPAEFIDAEAFKAEIGEIRNELEGLSLEIPKSFQDLSQIATLGNQLEVPKDALVDFTETIATFSTVTDVSVDEAAKAFGSLQHTLDVPVEEFSNLASSIVLVGRSSAATENEILSLVRELSRQANGAGFAAEEVVALAGALGTLRIPPERSRGALTTYFETVNKAVAEGGDKLEMFSQLLGIGATDLSSMVQNGQGVEVLQRFLATLGDTSVEVSKNLDALGLSQLRISDTFRGLAANGYLFDEYLQTSKKGYLENIELQRQMGLISDDLASKWQFFLNALALVADAVGNEVAPAFGVLLDAATSLIVGFAKFAESDFGAGFIRVAATVGILVAAVAGIIAPLALAGASFAAFKTAMAAIPWATIGRYFTGIRAGAIAAAGGMTTLAGASRVAGAALKGFMRATIILAVLGAASELIFNFGGSMQWLAGVASNVVSFIGTVFGELMNFVADVARNLSGIAPALGDWSQDLRGFAQESRIAISSSTQGFTDWAGTLENADTVLGEFGTGLGEAGVAAGDFGGSLDDVGDSASDAANEIRTLVDYAGDLSSVMQRAFDIRFGPDQALDTIKSGWQAVAKAAEDARAAAQEHARTLADMGADRSIKQYWLSVAENYGDELRAAKLRAELAELDASMAKEKSDLATAQDKASMSLNGNSEAAIANRATLLGLVGNYQSYLQALAASGASQATLQAESLRLRGEFVNQATQMGFNRNEVDKYSIAFEGMTTIINNVPRNITVTANVDPALQALNEFVAAARTAGTNAGNGLANGIAGGADIAAAQLAALQAAVNAAKAVGDIFANNVYLSSRRDRKYGGKSTGGSWESGGYTGNGGTGSIAGVVHGQEYVFSADAVRNAGGPRVLDNMHAMYKSGKSPAPVGIGASGTGPGLVDLSAASIQALSHSLAANLQLVLPPAALAGSVGAHNVVSGLRGNG